MSLPALLEKLERCTRGDLALDYEIDKAVGLAHARATLPHYSRSVDAALTLVPPHCNWVLKTEPCGYFATVATFDDEGFVRAYTGQASGKDVPPALALCIAALRARAA